MPVLTLLSRLGSSKDPRLPKRGPDREPVPVVVVVRALVAAAASPKQAPIRSRSALSAAVHPAAHATTDVLPQRKNQASLQVSPPRGPVAVSCYSTVAPPLQRPLPQNPSTSCNKVQTLYELHQHQVHMHPPAVAHHPKPIIFSTSHIDVKTRRPTQLPLSHLRRHLPLCTHHFPHLLILQTHRPAAEPLSHRLSLTRAMQHPNRHSKGSGACIPASTSLAPTTTVANRRAMLAMTNILCSPPG